MAEQLKYTIQTNKCILPQEQERRFILYSNIQVSNEKGEYISTYAYIDTYVLYK